MAKMFKKSDLFVIVGIITLVFIVFVWPTPYWYMEFTERGIIVRINRFTGHAERIRIEGPPAAEDVERVRDALNQQQRDPDPSTANPSQSRLRELRQSQPVTRGLRELRGQSQPVTPGQTQSRLRELRSQPLK